MNNLVYLNNDPILMELDSSVDRKSTMKMIAFKYFNSDMDLLENYLKDNHYKSCENNFELKLIEPKSQLEFSF
tara:strand:- start:97 stop:315 length:219 start_codon:yes stop_codon:yes gene_type:complete